MQRREFLKGMFGLSFFGFVEDDFLKDKNIWRVLEISGDIFFPNSKYFKSASELGAVSYLKEAMQSGYFKDFDKKIILEGAKILDYKYAFLKAKNKKDVLYTFVKTKEGSFWSEIFLSYLLEGIFCDPIYGGNKNMQGYRALNFIPGFPRPKSRYANGKRV